MSNAGELFLSAFPIFPDDYAGEYLSNKQDQDECSELQSKRLGNDEAEPERAWNHECREGPEMPGGARAERVAVEKHYS